MAVFSYAALRSEIDADPVGYGYAALVQAGNDSGIAALLNKLRDGTDGKPAITVRKLNITGDDIQAAWNDDDVKTGQNAPNAMQVATYQGAISSRMIPLVNDDGTDNFVLTNLKKCLTAGTATRTRLNAISQQVGNRAKQLWGPTQPDISDNDIARAFGRGA